MFDAVRLPGAGDQVRDLLRDGDAVVREALEVPAGQCDVDGRGGGFLPVAAGDRLEHAQVEIVHGGVGLHDVAGHFKIPGFQQHRELLGDQQVMRGEALEGLTQLGRDHGGGVAEPCELGQVPGEVAHPLQGGAHPEGAHDHPQVAGHGALQGEDIDGTLVEAVLQEVDPCIGGNDILGQIDVGALEGSRGFPDGLSDQFRDFDELFPHLGELFLKNLAHVCVLSSEILPATSSGGPISVTSRHSNCQVFQRPVNCYAPIDER